MRYFKKLSGEKCYLSPISLEDAAQYTEWLNDLDTARTLTIASMNITLHGEKDALERLSQDHTYAIVDSQTDTLLGNCGLLDWNQLHGTAEAGIFIGDEENRGQGIGSEALRLLCGYAFDYLNIKSLFLRVYSFNPGAVRCYEKVGFQKIGSWRSSLEREGKRYDQLLMDLLPEDLRR